jgi:uncharacterized protein (TIGR03083 family)
MKEPSPILVAHLFPEVLDTLVDLLSQLSAQDWERDTACADWSVKDVVLHLLGVEVGNLSRRRDGFSLPAGPIRDQADLLAIVNDLNTTWVQATRRLSPRLLCDLLQFTGLQACDYFKSLDPYALGGPVSWAGPDPAPVWLDLAREYTERWHHQQHIRDAVGRPGLKEPRFLAPVLDAFVRALPFTYREVEAAEGTSLVLTLSGPAGGQWTLQREAGRWTLYQGAALQPDAQVILDQDDAWRLFTKGLSPREALARASVSGDSRLGLKALDLVSIIA